MSVFVVGGGAIGLAIAWRVRGAGHEVTVVDPDPARAASLAAGGMLAPVTEVHYGEEQLLTLNVAASERYPDFVAELVDVTGADIGYRRSGTLTVARDVDDQAALADLYDFQRHLGLDVERLSSRECRRLEPALAPSIRGGFLATGDHQIDNRKLVAALRTACERTGVAFLAAEVAGLDAHQIRLDTGASHRADHVVVASGAWSGPWTQVPIRPVKGQIVRLRIPGLGSDAQLASRTIRGLDCYLVPRANGEIVVGATAEERGFDVSVTAGAVLDLLRAAYELLPGIAEVEFSEVSAGLRPGTPDNAPLLGRETEDGPILACGHYRNGILLTPVTADAIATLIDRGELPPEALPFSPTRMRGEVSA